jgi:hypothetical protein
MDAGRIRRGRKKRMVTSVQKARCKAQGSALFDAVDLDGHLA